MGITVRQALEIGSLKQAKVVGGHQGLDNVITIVNIMEVPQVAKWMKGGELLVTAGLTLKDDPDLRKNLIYELAQKGVTAFGIKPGQYFDKVPEDMIEHANVVGMPLIELPKDVPYMDFMLPILEILINNQLYLLKKSEEIHNKLLEVFLAGWGVPSVCQALSQLVGNPVLIVERGSNLLSSSWPTSLECEPDKWYQEIMLNLDSREEELLSLNPHRGHRFKLFSEDTEQDIIIAPVEINGSISGYLAILEHSRKLDDHDLMALQHASTIVALVFVKEKAIFEAERQIRSELLEDLIAGSFRYEEAVIRRASYLNFNLNTRLAVFTLDIDRFESYLATEARRDESHVQEVKSEILQVAHNIFLDYPGGAMLLAKSDSVTGLIRLSTVDEVKILRAKIEEVMRAIIRKFPKLKISAGVGRSLNGTRSIKQSYEEALVALRVGRFMYGLASLTFFDDLGPYLFLYELKDSSAVQSFYQDNLGKIILYDKQNNTELLKTLKFYFKNDCNLRLTAESLFIHKNSVIYRVKKIEEITGLNMTNTDDRFNLQLCLKLGQIISDVSTGMNKTR
ncbi:MAG: hypothetical protein APF76_02710 [Desulfitibacter sp. BRH_c19]|nr:MAG: hypothetical protein APF76_02710 [Desulfitibacter sp. BRH_c19]